VIIWGRDHQEGIGHVRNKRYSAEEIASKLWQADVELSIGAAIGQECKQIDRADQGMGIHLRWRA